mgnify:CR=1 FL=1
MNTELIEFDEFSSSSWNNENTLIVVFHAGVGEDYGFDQLNEKKREVLRRCIYGVDINQLAVDLAMLTLWLETAYSVTLTVGTEKKTMGTSIQYYGLWNLSGTTFKKAVNLLPLTILLYQISLILSSDLF